MKSPKTVPGRSRPYKMSCYELIRMAPIVDATGSPEHSRPPALSVGQFAPHATLKLPEMLLDGALMRHPSRLACRAQQDRQEFSDERHPLSLSAAHRCTRAPCGVSGEHRSPQACENAPGVSRFQLIRRAGAEARGTPSPLKSRGELLSGCGRTKMGSHLRVVCRRSSSAIPAAPRRLPTMSPRR